jgi:hypothetical protein
LAGGLPGVGALGAAGAAGSGRRGGASEESPAASLPCMKKWDFSFEQLRRASCSPSMGKSLT